jgi:integrase
MQKVRSRWYAYIDAKGRKRKSWPLKTTRKRTAEKRLRNLRDAYDAGEFDPWNGGWLTREPVALVDAERAFCEAKERKGLRERTVDTYRGILRRFRETLPPGATVQDVTPEDVRTYVRTPDVSNATQRKRYRHLRAFFNWIAETDRADGSPLESVDPPKKETKEKAFLRPEDVERLLIATRHHAETTTDAAGRSPDLDWLRAIIRVAVATGLRRGELLNLRWRDVDFQERAVHVRNRDGFKTKGGSERRVPLRGDALDALREMHAASDPLPTDRVFTDRKGKPVRPGRVSRRFKAMARLAKLDERIHFHSLRHTCASWLAMQGVPMRVIQEVMGHSTVSVTEMYSHLAPETLEQAMEETFG